MAARRTAPKVLFRVACGPRQGFGHLMRAVRLAEGLGVAPIVSIRGPAGAAVAARRLGVRVSTAPLRALRSNPPRLLVVDDPNARTARPWIDAARRRGLPVASIHDLGLGADGADLVIDGSVRATDRTWSAPRQLLGPRYCVLSVAPGVAARRRAERREGRVRVVVSLGGGPRQTLALRVARAISHQLPGARVVVAAGIASARSRNPESDIEWVSHPEALRTAMRLADVAIVGGGTSLYECCAAGTPAIAVAVVAAQRPTIEAMARAGAARDGGALTPVSSAAPRLARLAAELLAQPRERRRLSSRGRRLVDGRGVVRVAAALTALSTVGSGRVPGRGR